MFCLWLRTHSMGGSIGAGWAHEQTWFARRGWNSVRFQVHPHGSTRIRIYDGVQVTFFVRSFLYVHGARCDGHSCPGRYIHARRQHTQRMALGAPSSEPVTGSRDVASKS